MDFILVLTLMSSIIIVTKCKLIFLFEKPKLSWMNFLLWVHAFQLLILFKHNSKSWLILNATVPKYECQVSLNEWIMTWFLYNGAILSLCLKTDKIYHVLVKYTWYWILDLNFRLAQQVRTEILLRTQMQYIIEMEHKSLWT